MPIRVRCPECRSVLDVPTGARPSCPKCGFAGRGRPRASQPEAAASPAAPAATPVATAATGVKFTRIQPAAPQPPQQQEVEWHTETAESAEPAEPGQSPAAEESPPDAWGEEWPQQPEATEAGAWDEPQAAEPPKPARRGLFGRRR